MLKKTEESEWSRFSRVLNKDARPAEEAPAAKEQAPEPAPAAAQEAAPAAPAAATPPPPAVTRPVPQQPASYVRPHSAPVVASQGVDEAETIIGVHSFFDGTFRCESSMRIKGTVQGEIACTRSLAIEESAKVNAKVTASNATIAGQVDGSVTCDGRLEVLATGRVTGELTAAVLIIQEGAFFEGHLKMKERKVEAPAPEAEQASSD